MTKLSLILFCCFSLCSISAFSADEDVKLAEEKAIAQKQLEANANQIMLKVFGMCCKTCSIGIGRKVCDLTFVDLKAWPNGVHVNRQTSMLTVTLKPEEKLDVEKLVASIRAAGYKPIRLYQLQKDKSLSVTTIAPVKK